MRKRVYRRKRRNHVTQPRTPYCCPCARLPSALQFLIAFTRPCVRHQVCNADRRTPPWLTPASAQTPSPRRSCSTCIPCCLFLFDALDMRRACADASVRTATAHAWPARATNVKCPPTRIKTRTHTHTQASTDTAHSTRETHRSPVGGGPSSNTWPRCPVQRAHRISDRGRKGSE